jgi:transposase
MRTKLRLTDLPEIRIETILRDHDGYTVHARSAGHTNCPDCETLSTARKDTYRRRLQDLPIQGVPVRLERQITRWRCRNKQCARQSFAEPLDPSVPACGRRTWRVRELARLVGHAVGGRPAERLWHRLGSPQSDDTVLRTLKQEAAKREKSTLRVVGLDDGSWQQGRSDGTIVVDWERREVVDVLPDRSAETTAPWLRQHPEIEIISRDRCGLSAQGAKAGAPQARPVADRFHLLQN